MQIKKSSIFFSFTAGVSLVKRTITMASGQSNLEKAEKEASGRPSIVWFRNDLRFHDNEAISLAFQASQTIIPVYCFDPRQFGETNNFGFPKTGGKESPYQSATFIIFSEI